MAWRLWPARSPVTACCEPAAGRIGKGSAEGEGTEKKK
jgi:hypothetical protein